MQHPTEEEKQAVIDYFNWQAPDLTVIFAQKVFEENVLSHRHDVWDIHTNKDRWWVITNPTNLYSQEQFPNLDLVVTFHVGLCIRIPRSEKQQLSDLPIEPLGECYRLLGEASDQVGTAQEVSDFQAVGVRCRETLLAFIDAAQIIMPLSATDPPPKKGDLRSLTDHLWNRLLRGDSHEYRRRLMKALFNEAWSFVNWLTHSKHSTWHDAEAAFAITENAIGLGASALIRHVRGVPEVCPACGSFRLTPERGFDADNPEVESERPVCTKCGWTGPPIEIVRQPEPPPKDRQQPEGEHVIPTVPLRELKRP